MEFEVLQRRGQQIPLTDRVLHGCQASGQVGQCLGRYLFGGKPRGARFQQKTKLVNVLLSIAAGVAPAHRHLVLGGAVAGINDTRASARLARYQT